MYKIGDKVHLKNVDRCRAYNGYDVYLDPAIDVDGVVVQTADFIDRRICIEFEIKYQKHTLWKYEFDVPPKNESGNIEPVRQSN